MELFMRSPRVIISTGQIMELVWGGYAEAEVSVVGVHISSLRKKLRAIGPTAVIRVRRDIGYVLTDEAA